MSQGNKSFFCLIISLCAFILSLLGLIFNSFEVSEIKRENEVLRETVAFQSDNFEKEIAEQNKTVEEYKQFVDDIARCIVDGEW